jgi:formylglycine-generating enzyme required for sulfatase activity
MTRHGKQYGAIVIVFVGLVALPGSGQAQQEITGKGEARMMLVPAGEFTMGSNEVAREQPLHRVSLDAYYMDMDKVTIVQYAKFLDATSLEAPPDWTIMNQPRHQMRPVVMINWSDANTYCRWAGKRLPTEAEWEKAEGGTDGRRYPWDNPWNDTLLLLLPLETSEYGKSPYGLYDMAGHGWEWVSDWYENDYYKNSPSQNPQGPERGESKVVRGGLWYVHPESRDSASRFNFTLTYRSFLLGFRCAKTP